MKYNYKIKIAVFLSVLSVNNNNFNKNIFAKNNIKFQRKLSWSENHPVAAKILKGLGITASLTALGVGGYYGTRFVLDKIYPERVEEREKLKKTKEKLSKISNEIINYALKDSLTEDEEAKLEKLKKDEIYLKENIKEKSESKNTFLNLAVVGGIIAFGKGIADIVNTVGKFAKSLSTISYLRWAYNNFVEMFKSVKNIFKSPPKEMQKEDALKLFDTLFESYYGQKEAISNLKSHIFDILIARDQAKCKGEKYSKCDVIYLYGPSGVGKSFITKRLPSVLLASGEPLTILSSYFDKEKKSSIIDQLVNIESKNSDSERYEPEKLLPSYMKNNPGGVIIFEEYDKVCTPALDELLRGLMDEGVVNVGGQPLEWSGTIIITSNEDDLSMEGFDPKKVKDLDEASIQEGRTRVEHSKSFLNRIKKVKFENLAAEDCEKIIKDHFDEMSSYWSLPDNGGIEITLDENSLKELAIKVENKKQGARPIDLWIIPEIKIAIGEKIKSLANLSNEHPDSDASTNNSSDLDNSSAVSLLVKYENNKFLVLEPDNKILDDNSLDSSVNESLDNRSFVSNDDSVINNILDSKESEKSTKNNNLNLDESTKLFQDNSLDLSVKESLNNKSFVSNDDSVINNTLDLKESEKSPKNNNLNLDESTKLFKDTSLR